MKNNLRVFIAIHLRQAWRRRFMTNMFIFAILFASFLVLNAGLLAAKNFQALTQNWGDKIEMNVYLKNVDDSKKLQEELEKNPLVHAVTFVSQEMAIRELQAQIGTSAPDLIKDQELTQFIPASLQLEMKASNSAGELFEKVKQFATELKSRAQVEDVQYGQGLLVQFQTVLGVFHKIGYVFLLSIFAGSLFMILFIIRNSLQQRREEIEILELVGASRAMIRVPVIIEGVLFSAIAGLASLAISKTFFFQLKQTLSAEDIFVYVAHELQFFTTAQSVGLAATYIALGAFASLVCIRGLNSGFAAAEKLKLSSANGDFEVE